MPLPDSGSKAALIDLKCAEEIPRSPPICITSGFLNFPSNADTPSMAQYFSPVSQSQFQPISTPSVTSFAVAAAAAANISSMAASFAKYQASTLVPSSSLLHSPFSPFSTHQPSPYLGPTAIPPIRPPLIDPSMLSIRLPPSLQKGIDDPVVAPLAAFLPSSSADTSMAYFGGANQNPADIPPSIFPSSLIGQHSNLSLPLNTRVIAAASTPVSRLPQQTTAFNMTDMSPQKQLHIQHCINSVLGMSASAHRSGSASDVHPHPVSRSSPLPLQPSPRPSILRKRPGASSSSQSLSLEHSAVVRRLQVDPVAASTSCSGGQLESQCDARCRSSSTQSSASGYAATDVISSPAVPDVIAGDPSTSASVHRDAFCDSPRKRMRKQQLTDVQLHTDDFLRQEAAVAQGEVMTADLSISNCAKVRRCHNRKKCESSNSSDVDICDSGSDTIEQGSDIDELADERELYDNADLLKQCCGSSTSNCDKKGCRSEYVDNSDLSSIDRPLSAGTAGSDRSDSACTSSTVSAESDANEHAEWLPEHRLRMSLLAGYNLSWHPKQWHFLKSSDVKVKEFGSNGITSGKAAEKKKPVAPIKWADINGWQLLMVADHMKEMEKIEQINLEEIQAAVVPSISTDAVDAASVPSQSKAGLVELLKVCETRQQVLISEFGQIYSDMLDWVSESRLSASALLDGSEQGSGASNGRKRSCNMSRSR